MKIAIFTDSFLPVVGGTQSATLGLADALSKKHTVVVCCPKHDEKYVDNFNFKVFRTKSLKLTKTDYWGLPNLSKEFKQKLEIFKPDIIHCQTVSALTRYAQKYAKTNKIPVIMTLHTKFKRAFGSVVKIKPILSLMLKNIAKKVQKSDMVFTVSKDMESELQSYGYNGTFNVIKNGSNCTIPKNLEDLANKADERFSLKDKLVFLYVGRIEKYKNIEFSLKALEKFKKVYDNFVFLIVGKGTNGEYFKKLVKELDLKDNVIFTGLINNDELSSVYARANLFLFPSIFDNDALVIIEAAVHNTPAIVLENTGASERLINNETGFIVEHNLEKFVNKIIQVSRDLSYLEKIGKTASEKLPKTWDQTANEYLTYYKDLIEKKKCQ
ncbi:MAG: glycosyltransferase [Clostridia bacterium]|nr:glycosyltransferase [Clostridia bacterium]